MDAVFICPKCKAVLNTWEPDVCDKCGYVIRDVNGIYIFTDDPDMNLDDENNDKYIGYENIGEYYSGKYWYKISHRDLVTGKAVADLIGDGILLDLACGDGIITVPAAKYGCRVIAADISKKMLTLLMKKAKYNNVNLENSVVCRMNALEIPLADESVDYVIANSVLHLISNPKKVLSEIKRVLKHGGKYLSLDDLPGKQNDDEVERNEGYIEIANGFYRRYWELLIEMDIKPKKYSWQFDKSQVCEELFTNKNTIEVKLDGEYTNTLGDGMLYRMSGKGFSDQSDVPDDIHRNVFTQVVNEYIHEYGESFTETAYTGKEKNVMIELFEK